MDKNTIGDKKDQNQSQCEIKRLQTKPNKQTTQGGHLYYHLFLNKVGTYFSR